ncbi:VOC family protein [Dysgonomonas sp. ZJ709]|uniref:VOC family protein n=1 Tax=Dysgonomonas sp. ZJ709 TaxID=2709797 RepID=UPI0013EDED15|nr:VOC family protein [Dysgonomonas sp. ZJ709]
MEILRTLYRIYTTPERLEAQVFFYEKLYEKPYFMKFYYQELDITLVEIGDILILSGLEETWKNLPVIKNTSLTIYVLSIDEAYSDLLMNEEVSILYGPQEYLTGFNMGVQNPDGLIFEYVQHTEKVSKYKK